MASCGGLVAILWRVTPTIYKGFYQFINEIGLENNCSGRIICCTFTGVF